MRLGFETSASSLLLLQKKHAILGPNVAGEACNTGPNTAKKSCGTYIEEEAYKTWSSYFRESKLHQALILHRKHSAPGPNVAEEACNTWS